MPIQRLPAPGAQSRFSVGMRLRAPVGDATGFRAEHALFSARYADDRRPALRAYWILIFNRDFQLLWRTVVRDRRFIRLVAAAKGFDGADRNIEQGTDALISFTRGSELSDVPLLLLCHSPSLSAATFI